MDTLDRLMRSHGLKAEDIEHISAGVSTNTLHHCGWDFDPAAVKGVLGAQMNLRYGLSVMALDRVATPAQYTDERIAQADVAGFLRRIEVCVHDAFDTDPALRLAARLEVRTTDGRTCVEETLYRKGSIQDPLSAAQLETKFLSLTSGVLSRQAADACLEQIQALDTRPRVPVLGSTEPRSV